MRTVAVQVPAGIKKDNVCCVYSRLTMLFADFAEMLFDKKQKLQKVDWMCKVYLLWIYFFSEFVDFQFKQESKTFAWCKEPFSSLLH